MKIVSIKADGLIQITAYALNSYIMISAGMLAYQGANVKEEVQGGVYTLISIVVAIVEGNCLTKESRLTSFVIKVPLISLTDIKSVNTTKYWQQKAA